MTFHAIRPNCTISSYLTLIHILYKQRYEDTATVSITLRHEVVKSHVPLMLPEPLPLNMERSNAHIHS